MGYAGRPDDLRRDPRVAVELPAQISVGSQLIVHGTLKDLSSKSAFITMKSSLYLQINDEVGFFIQRSPLDTACLIEGMARISRIVVGEGMAIYFTSMNDASTARLKKLVGDTHGQG